ncbi:hypothetical protein CYLTODRAFT_296163 [Cylindrobasidium torrendii FP15055 ss-10]|uniref:Uncharacterized protein n=1 Tax=Cylindrobasidium torrendii FP15055 ss-10 TaxID=1314674 RepID=A0A0D7BAS7_9AGAR|nr:hypothetical protein CYLTODRAFT_296163 [Cylindrobasidium torrendii FP15055 ss-10]
MKPGHSPSASATRFDAQAHCVRNSAKPGKGKTPTQHGIQKAHCHRGNRQGMVDAGPMQKATTIHCTAGFESRT